MKNNKTTAESDGLIKNHTLILNEKPNNIKCNKAFAEFFNKRNKIAILPIYHLTHEVQKCVKN